MKMSTELDVFVGNTTVLDEDVYQLWLNGHTGYFYELVIRTFPFNISGDDILFILVNSQRCSENADGSRSLVGL